MTLILEAVIFGVLTGGVYALMASGLTLIFGVMRIINVGHGALVILGAYLSYALLSSGAHIDPFVSLLITMPAMFILGVVLQLAFIRPLKDDREALVGAGDLRGGARDRGPARLHLQRTTSSS